MSDQIQSFVVRKRMDYAEVFIRETHYPASEISSERWAATFACVSSYGVYGHHWSHMGSRFSEFVRDMDTSYLLGKIAKRDYFDEKAFDKWLRRQIFTYGKTNEQKREAARAWRSLREDFGGRAAAHAAFADSTIFNATSGDWCDTGSDVYDPQAVGFAEHLWPLIVEKLNVDAPIAHERATA